jgi:radical SAM protein with 4Fe4S-binding SPASM domain
MGRLLQLTFTGGEPFLRDDFTDLVEVFHRVNRAYHLGIATSGFNPDRTEAGIRRILERCSGCRLTVGLPVEGPPGLNDEIRGVDGFFERTTETLARLKRLKKNHPRLTLLIDITASAFNRGQLIETYELIRDRLSPDVTNVILTRGEPREEGARELDPTEVACLHALMEGDIRAGRVPGYSFFGQLIHAKDIVLRRMALDIFRNSSYHLPCQAGRAAGVLMPEGDVYPCELWNESLGNVRETGFSFPDVWNSEKAKEVRAKILDSRCTCYHQCFLSNNIFWNLKSWPGILAEWARILAGK